MSGFQRDGDDRAPPTRGVPFEQLSPLDQAWVAGYEARRAGILSGRIPEPYQSEELSRAFIAGMNARSAEENPLTPEQVAARMAAGGAPPSDAEE